MNLCASLQVISVDAGAVVRLGFLSLAVRLNRAAAAVEERDGRAVVAVGALRGAPELAQLQLGAARARQLDLPVGLRARLQRRLAQNHQLTASSQAKKQSEILSLVSKMIKTCTNIF